MALPAPNSAILIDITGDTTGFVTGLPPNDAVGDLDATLNLPNPGWTPLGTTWEISQDPGIGTATINFFTGEWEYTVDPDEYAQLDDGEIVFDTFEVEVTGYAFNPGGSLRSETSTITITIGIEGVCFTGGTLIDGEFGPIQIDELQVGDRVATLDNGLQEIKWIEYSEFGRDDLAAKRNLWPVRIRKGALGPDCPNRDLFVSQQHRILVGGAKVELLFGTEEVLTSAKSLCRWPGIEIVEPTDDLRYFHILLDRHEILISEGAPAESLFLGEEALHSLSSEGLQELVEIFPDHVTRNVFSFGPAARRLLKEKEALALV